MSITGTTEHLDAVLARQRYEDACVAWFEATENPELATLYNFKHPDKCQCAPCLKMTAENERRMTARIALRNAAVEARKALAC